jgi:hypothetical protein
VKPRLRGLPLAREETMRRRITLHMAEATAQATRHLLVCAGEVGA